MSGITEFTIGAGISGMFPYNGAMDDFRIYDYALNEIQVESLYKSYDLIAWYKFDGTSGDIAKDSSAYGNDAVISGATHVNGRIGEALNCNIPMNLSITHNYLPN